MDKEQIQNLIAALEVMIGQNQATQNISETRVKQEIENAKLNDARSEAVLTMLLQIKQKQGNTVDAIKEIIDYLKKQTEEPALKALQEMADILKNAVVSVTPDPEKIKGKDGYTPEKGKDYFTDQEIKEIVKIVLSDIILPKDGYTPVKGKDYFDGKDGKTPIKGVDYFDGQDAVINYDKVADLVTKRLPKIEKQKTIDEIIVDLKGKLSYDDLKDLPILYKQASRDYSFIELTDTPKEYKGQAGKTLSVKASEDGVEFAENKTTDEKVKYNISDPSAGYLKDKVIAGNGISVAEGAGVNENKLVITNNGVLVEIDPIWNAEKANYALLSQVWKINGNTIGAKKTIGSLDNFDFGILTNNTERVTVLANGNVGIGTTAPGVTVPTGLGTPGNVLEIKSPNNVNGLYLRGSDGLRGLDITNEGQSTGKVYFDSIYNNASVGYGGFQFRVRTSGTPVDAMRIDSVGNVGIGITTPTAKLDVNSDILRLRTAKTPATSGASGNQGDIAWDADYIYICTATNTWKRSAIATW